MEHNNGTSNKLHVINVRESYLMHVFFGIHTYLFNEQKLQKSDKKLESRT